MRPGLSKRSLRILIGTFTLAIAVALPSTAQYGGPHTTTGFGGHALAPPATITAPSAGFSPAPSPSVTSLPNYGYHYHYAPYYNGYYRGRGYRNGAYGGWAYVMPYYYPVDDSAYGYDYVGGGSNPDLYSGPPIGPNDPTLHLMAEQPPRPYVQGPPPEAQYYPPPRPPMAPPIPAAPTPEVKPSDPTVLVFRNGHKQEVTNYAIMGDTLYVFDEGRKKIALADLDLPATVKANDDRGTEFRVPPSPAKKKSSTVPQSASPDQTPSTAAPSSIAAAIP